jgi:hypothetical protein
VILADFLKVGGEPTLWIWIGSPSDFSDLCELISGLGEGTVSSVSSRSLQKLFKQLPGISELILAVVMPSDIDKDATISSRNRHITWKLTRERWRWVLQWLRALPAHRHDYIEYPKATVHVSYMERLRETVGASKGKTR